MEIEFNPTRVLPPDLASSRVMRAFEPRAPRDGAAFASTAALDQAVSRIPVVRPEAVNRAKALLATVNYPPEETMNSIANLLAIHIDTQA